MEKKLFYEEQSGNENWQAKIEEILRNIPEERAGLLWHILMEADLQNLEELERDISEYAKLLSTKDEYGICLLCRLDMIVRYAQKSQNQNVI